MKRASLMVPILALALTLPIFAQAERDVKTGGAGKEETLKLMINGGLDTAFCYESGQLRETVTWTNGGVGGVNIIRDPYYFFNGPAWVSFYASLQDNVELNLTIRTVPFSDGNGSQANGGTDAIIGRANWGDDITNGVVMKYAYMRIKELFNPHWSLTIGQQDIIWDVRGKGNAVFMDVAHAESPWGDIDRAWATSVRMEEYPVGFKVNYNQDSMAFELGIFPVIHEAQTLGGGLLPAVSRSAAQQAIYYINGVFNIDDQGSKIGGIISLFHGINPTDNVVTLGVSGVFVPSKDFELFGDFYYQLGRAWSQGRGSMGAAGPYVNTGDHSAYMVLLGGRMDIPGDTGVFIELHFLYASGHDMDEGAEFSGANGFAVAGVADRSHEFMSYENYDVMVILNSNEWGYDFDNNIMQITGQVGLMVSAGGSMKNNLHFIMKLAYAMAPEEWRMNAAGPHPDTEEDVYGFEVDLTARWYLNKNASLYWTFAYLGGSGIIEAFSTDEDDFAWTMLLGVNVNN